MPANPMNELTLLPVEMGRAVPVSMFVLFRRRLLLRNLVCAQFQRLWADLRLGVPLLL